MRIKTIIIDDDMSGLIQLTTMLSEYSNMDMEIGLLGAFLNPREALKTVQSEKVQLAFLDIKMPEINGFELAEKIMQIHPDVRIIFVTAYKEYAVQAFELHALDYLIKPVCPKRLETTLRRAARYFPVQSSFHIPDRLAKLVCMSRLQYIDAQGHKHDFIWKTLKAPELFAYLIYRRDKTVGKQELMDLLWPGYDYDKAIAQLYTAIYQIRKVIKKAALDLEIKFKNEGYQLVWGNLVLDMEEWKQAVANAPPVTSYTIEQHRSVKSMYTGNFLEEHPYAWAVYEQERMLLIWLNHVRKMAEFYISEQNYTEAILLYQEIKEKTPDREEGYFGLMKMYAAMHQPVEVRRQFRMMADRLRQELDVDPSKDLLDWYIAWSEEEQQLMERIHEQQT